MNSTQAPSLSPTAGYFTASIFDGKIWRNLSIRSLLADNGYRSSSQHKKDEARARVVGAIEERNGGVIEYRNRAYRFAEEPDAPIVAEER